MKQAMSSTISSILSYSFMVLTIILKATLRVANYFSYRFLVEININVWLNMQKLECSQW